MVPHSLGCCVRGFGRSSHYDESMHILVTAASKHGATDDVADAIAKRLQESGMTVDRIAPSEVTTVAPYDAVVVGSAVYVLQWMPEAHDFMERFGDDLQGKPVWAFSVGMNGVPKHAPQDPTRVGPLLTHVNCRDLRTFPGRYKPSLLSLRERSVARLAGVVEGDFRDWEAIEQWTDGIIAELSA